MDITGFGAAKGQARPDMSLGRVIPRPKGGILTLNPHISSNNTINRYIIESRPANVSAKLPDLRNDRCVWCESTQDLSSSAVDTGASVSRADEDMARNRGKKEENKSLSPWPTNAARKTAFGNTPEPSQVYAELPGSVTLDVQANGRLPQWLKGAYVRNGPGMYDNGTQNVQMRHMFDGYAMILKFELDGESNTAVMSHSFVQSDAYRHVKEHGVMKWREFGTPLPRNSLGEAIFDVGRMVFGSVGLARGETDNSSVHVLVRKGKDEQVHNARSGLCFSASWGYGMVAAPMQIKNFNVVISHSVGKVTLGNDRDGFRNIQN